MSNLTLDEISILDRVIDKPELQPRLFEKIKKLKWFDVLKEKGLLDAIKCPKPINTVDEYYNIPSWPVTQYLVGSSMLLQEEQNFEFVAKYLNLIRGVTLYAQQEGFSNYRTWWQFAKIMRNIPVNEISLDDIRLIQFWLKDEFDQSLIAAEIGQWVVDLLEEANGYKIKLAKALLEVLFGITEVKREGYQDKKEPKLQVERYTASKIAKDVACKSGTEMGIVAIELFESKLQQLLDILGNDQWSTIWRNAIEKHEQNSLRDEPVDIMINMLRDALLSYCTSLNSTTPTKLSKMLSSQYQCIRRIAIYVAGKIYAQLQDNEISLVINVEHFTDHYRHELWHFLKNNFDNFSDEHQNFVAKTIKNVACVDKNKVLNEKATAYKKSLWYAAIKHAHRDYQSHYEQSIVNSSQTPEHPDFASYSSIIDVSENSPVSIIELKVMLQEPKSLVSFLNNYKSTGNFYESGIEGLVKTFGELVKTEIKQFIDYLECYSNLQPHFLHELFASFLAVWESKQEQNWDFIWTELLTFAELQVSTDKFWSSTVIGFNDSFIGNTTWVVCTLSRLIQAGCKSDEHAFGPDKCDAAKRVLELILSKQKGGEFKLDSDAVNISINTARGQCLEAYINLALYQCRSHNNGAGEHQDIWLRYEEIFTVELNKADTANEYEFATFIVSYLPNFKYLSNEWTAVNLDKIFDESNQQRWLCAMQAYCFVGALTPDIHQLYKKHNFFEAIFDSSYLNNGIKKRYVELICVAYLHKLEKMDDEHGLFPLLLNRANFDELGNLVWYIWTLHDNKYADVVGLITMLWPKLIALIAGEDKKVKSFASKLCLWIEYIDKLDDTTHLWLLTIAPHAGAEHNVDTFIKGLARLSGEYTYEVFEIWKAMLTTYSPVYDDEAIKTILLSLISKGSKGDRAAKEIVGKYVENDDTRCVGLYNEVVYEFSSSK